jgi:non-homologous end joining protein Ku
MPNELLTLGEMVEKVPELYEALRERDSLANNVCELIARKAEYRQTFHKWQAKRKRVLSLVAKAMDAEDPNG